MNKDREVDMIFMLAESFRSFLDNRKDRSDSASRVHGE